MWVPDIDYIYGRGHYKNNGNKTVKLSVSSAATRPTGTKCMPT